MRIAYIEPSGGLSGDMMLGALVDVGLDLQVLTEITEALGVAGEVSVSARPVMKTSIAATKVDVSLRGHDHANHDVHHDDHGHEHDAGEEHGHDHGHDHDHEHAHHHDPGEAHDSGHHHHHGRSAGELMEVVEGSDLSERTIKRSVAIIRTLAEAEAKVHNSTAEEVHFHELGGLDTLVDVVGAVEGLARLGVERVYCAPLPIGHGWIEVAHGRLPVPAPATAELLCGVPTAAVDVEGETVTPTGAALAAALSDGFGRPASFTAERVGYGAGNADFDPVPNVVRLSVSGEVGEASRDVEEAGQVTVIETNVDDMTGEMVPGAIDAALDAGALDAWTTQITMKKGRPALLLRAICPTERAEAVTEALLRETTSLGVRMTRMDRRCLPRESVRVETRFGPIAVKLGYLDGRAITTSPEHEECARAAREHGVPLKMVYAAALAAAEGR